MVPLPDLSVLDAAQLEALVRHHNRQYWDLAAPEISDTDFDLLVRRLRRVRPDSPVLEALGPTSFGAEVEHRAPMLSLDKCYGDADLLKFLKSFKGPAVVSPKIDGVACSLIYDASGRLSLAATRGDGRRGEDVTANARRVRDIPAEVGAAAVEVRGELYLRLSRFNAEYARDFANPRNLTAGAIKQKDPTKTGAYGLSFFAYDLLGVDLTSEWDKGAWLREHGFATPPAERGEGEAVLALVQGVAAARDGYDYETDGVVIKADDLAEQRRLGATDHHPRYAIAFKFQGETGETALLEVEWSVARTGTITPVAVVDPVLLSGARVSRASLHHAGYVQKLGLTQGCTVAVTRRGGVIPHVEGVVAPGGAPVALPERCPSCGAAVQQRGDFLQCAQPDTCRDALIGTLEHFCKVLDIEGFGARHLEALVDQGLVRRPVDFFRLRVEDLLPLERMGDKLARKLVAAIQARRRVRLETFLTALGIDELGPVLAEKLSHRFETLEALRAASEEQLAQIDGVAEVVAGKVVEGLRALGPRIEGLLQEMAIEAPAAAAPAGDHPLAGKSVVFTGKMAQMDRKSAQQAVRAKGGKTPGAVTKELDLLVVGDEGSPLLGAGARSSKHKTAERYIAQGAAIAIISEAAFLKLLEG